MKKYYERLGLEEGASRVDIKIAFEKLSKELDPKNNNDLDFFREEYDLLVEAYNKLLGLNDTFQESSTLMQNDTNEKTKSFSKNNDLRKIKISSGKPCLIVFLLDQSGSMEDEWTKELGSKANCLANYINQIIREIGLKCMAPEGSKVVVKNRFEIAVIGYGKESSVYSAFQGALSFESSEGFIHSIQSLFDKPYQYIDKKPVWITPSAFHKTPMTEAFNTAKDVIQSWINWGNHSECHPPILINITDGIPTDSGYKFELLIEAAEEIKDLHTVHGDAMIFNCHIDNSITDPILFPDNLNNIYDEYAKVMFEISSMLMPKMIEEANRKHYNLNHYSRGFAYNAGPKELIKFLQIGSSAA